MLIPDRALPRYGLCLGVKHEVASFHEMGVVTLYFWEGYQSLLISARSLARIPRRELIKQLGGLAESCFVNPENAKT